MKRRTIGVFVAFVLAATSACNSTNRVQSGSELGVGATTSSSAGDTSPTSTGPTRTGAESSDAKTGLPEGDSDAGSGSTERGTAGGAKADAAVPGASDKRPLKLGFIIIKGGDALVANGLGTPVSFGNGKKEAAARAQRSTRRSSSMRPSEPATSISTTPSATGSSVQPSCC